MAFACRRESTDEKRAVEKVLREVNREGDSIVSVRGWVESLNDVGCCG